MTKTTNNNKQAKSKTGKKASPKAATKEKLNQKQQASLISPNDMLRITIPWTKLKKPYQVALNKAAKNMKVEGFRQGKVPAHIAEQQVSLEKIAEIILKDILAKKYIDALRQAKKQAITAPEYHLVSIEKEKDWILEAYFCEAPKINLKNYEKHIEVGKKAAEQFIKKHKQQVAQKNSKKQVKTNKSDKDEKQKQEQSTQLSPDQKQEIYYQHIVRELLLNIRPSIGELLLRRETQAEFEKFKEQLNSYQISIEKYLEQRQITLEELANELAGTVLNRLQIDFILAAIAKDRQLQVSDQALKVALAEIKDEKLREQISNHDQYLNSFKAQLLRRQTIDSLLKN